MNTLDTNPTTPLINIISESGSEDDMLMLEHNMTALFSYCKPKPVEFHKKKLGKQNFCFTGEYKYYVWEGDNWRVFVSNKRGVSLEVGIDSTIDEANKDWKDYAIRIGMLYIYGDERLG